MSAQGRARGTVPAANGHAVGADLLKPRRVGVLFVHGVGDPRRGDTLVEFGEPLYRWLERWVEQAPVGNPLHGHTVALADTRLRRAGDGTEPAQTTVRIVPPRDGAAGGEARPSSTSPGLSHSAEWLLAEAWWAEEFAPARFGDLARWALGIGPWLLFRYAALEFRELPRRRRVAVPSTLLHVMIALVGGLLIQATMLVLLAVAAIPGLRGLVSGLQTRLTGSLGDPYVLAASPVRFSAMVSQIQRDLRWLRERGCDRIAVVAHSQGAALAHAALCGEREPRVDLFVTYGSALSKLHLVRGMLRRGGTLFAGGVLSAAGIVTLGAAVTVPWLDGGQPIALPLGVLGGVLYLAGVFVPVRGGSRLTTADLRLPALVERGVESWRDYYATADPVPDGPLPFPDDASAQPDNLRRYRSRAIRNRESLVRDHATYWQNDEEFVARVAHDLARLAAWEPGPVADAAVAGTPARVPDGKALGAARIKRDARVDAISLAAVVAAVAVPVACLGLGGDGLAAVGGPPARLLAAAVDLLPGSPLGSPEGDGGGRATLGAMVVAGAVWLWYAGAIVPAWRGWERAEIDALFERRPRRHRSWPALLFPLIAGAPPLAAVAAVMLGVVGQALFDPGEVSERLAHLRGWIGIVLIFSVVLLASVKAWRRRWPAEPAGARPHPGRSAPRPIDELRTPGTGRPAVGMPQRGAADGV